MTVRVTASLRSVAYACDMVEPSFCELVCFGSDFDHDGFVPNSCLIDDRTITIMAERSHRISRKVLCLLPGGLREKDILAVKAGIHVEITEACSASCRR